MISSIAGILQALGIVRQGLLGSVTALAATLRTIGALSAIL